MSIIKQLSVFRDNNWQVDDIGADVNNISLSRFWKHFNLFRNNTNVQIKMI